MVSFELNIPNQDDASYGNQMNRRVLLSVRSEVEVEYESGRKVVVHPVLTLTEMTISELLAKIVSSLAATDEKVKTMTIRDSSNVSKLLNPVESSNGSPEKDENENLPIVFDSPCPQCSDADKCKTRMCFVEIPFFDELVLMTTVCDNCGYRDSEVKRGGGIRPQGVRYTLTLRSIADFNRELLKSEHCYVTIPSIELTVQPGTLGGSLTTVEGFLQAIKESLSSSTMAQEPGTRPAMQAFLRKLDACIKGEAFPFEINMDDPSGLSTVQNFYAPESDPDLVEEYYDRTQAQNDDMGLGDINVY